MEALGSAMPCTVAAPDFMRRYVLEEGQDVRGLVKAFRARREADIGVDLGLVRGLIDT